MIKVSGVNQVVARLRKQKQPSLDGIEAFAERELAKQWSGADVEYAVSVYKTPRGFIAQVTGPQVLFHEFGAGIKYSGVSHPKSPELGMGAGTYPGKGYWNRASGWWFPVEASDPRAVKYGVNNGKGYAHTYGNPAYMPTYKTAQALRRYLRERRYKID